MTGDGPGRWERGIGDTTGTLPFGEERLGNRSRGVPGLPAVKIDSEPAVASVPAVFTASAESSNASTQALEISGTLREGIGNIGQKP